MVTPVKYDIDIDLVIILWFWKQSEQITEPKEIDKIPALLHMSDICFLNLRHNWSMS